MRLFHRLLFVALGSILGACPSARAWSQSWSASERARGARRLACPAGFELRQQGEHRWCERPGRVDHRVPHCRDDEGHDDWRWSAHHRRCERRRPDGRVVTSTANVACDAGFRLGPGRGWCERAPEYRAARLMSPPAGTCAPRGRFVRTLACRRGKLMRVGGDRFVCTWQTIAATHVPICGPWAGHQDWRWDATRRLCRRGLPGSETYTTHNRRCRLGYRYEGRTGRCRRPVKNHFAAPTLR